jgi:hypothetical protein
MSWSIGALHYSSDTPTEMKNNDLRDVSNRSMRPGDSQHCAI